MTTNVLSELLAEKPWRHLAVFCQRTDRGYVWFAVIRDVAIEGNNFVNYKELYSYANNNYDDAVTGLIKKIVDSRGSSG
jgi:hypothetical protein